MRLHRLCFLILPLFLAIPAYADSILGTAVNFGVLGASTVTNTGPTVIINGSLGVSPGTAITNTAGITINGVSYAGNTTVPNDAGSAAAQADALTAYNALAAMAVTENLTGQNLGGLTLTPGVYKFDSDAGLTGVLTLNFEGLNNAEIIFQIGSALTTATGSSIVIENPGSNDGLFWDVGSSATLGTTTAFEGNILAVASITMNTDATIGCGSALALNGAVTMDNNTIATGCNGGGGTGGDTTSPVPEPESMTLFGSGLIALVGFVRRRINL